MFAPQRIRRMLVVGGSGGEPPPCTFRTASLPAPRDSGCSWRLASLNSPAPGLQTSDMGTVARGILPEPGTYPCVLGGRGASLALVCVFAPVQRWTGERMRGGGLRLSCVTHPPSSSTILESTQPPTENRSRMGMTSLTSADLRGPTDGIQGWGTPPMRKGEVPPGRRGGTLDGEGFQKRGLEEGKGAAS